MNRDNERQSAIILSVIGIIPVVWLALLIAPSVKGGLPEILPSLLTAFNEPFHIHDIGKPFNKAYIFEEIQSFVVSIVVFSIIGFIVGQKSIEIAGFLV